MRLTDEEFLRQHKLKLSSSSEPILSLARVLHRIAFANESEDGSGERMVGEFEPAPLYLDQAIIIASGDWASQIVAAIWEAKGIS